MQSESRIKLLFVIGQLVQGGTERYLYELCQALDRERFQIEILFRRRPRKEDFYYWKLKEQGFVIHTRLPRRRNFPRFLPRMATSAAWMRVEDAIYSVLYALALKDLLRQFDVVNIMQIENYHALRPHLRPEMREVVFLMSNAFQYAVDPYRRCSPDHYYRFVLMDPGQEKDLQESEVDLRYHSFFFPLSMAFDDYPELSPAPVTGGVVHLACFIRLSRERPIEPVFRCFAALAARRPAILHVYGWGDPRMFTGVLQELGIAESVIFEGHQVDMTAALQRDGINLVCMTCHDSVLGYASIEIAATSMPMVFCNVGKLSQDQVASLTEGSILAFHDPEAFAEACTELIDDPSALRAHGRKLSDYIRGTRDIRRNIGALEDYLISVANGRAVCD